MKSGWLTATAFALALPATSGASEMRLAVTEPLVGSGLGDMLVSTIADEIGIDIELLVVRREEALTLGATGEVDAILVHSRGDESVAAEESLVADGFATHRREIMYDDLVIVGPATDPAGVAVRATVTDALLAIAEVEAPFVTCGGESPFYDVEMALWDAAGVSPQGDWYHTIAKGPGVTFSQAASLNAYVLTDRATWLAKGGEDGLSVVFSGDPALVNRYVLLPMNPESHAEIRAEQVAAFEAWLTSERGRALIEGYSISGEALFTVGEQAT